MRKLGYTSATLSNDNLQKTEPIIARSHQDRALMRSMLTARGGSQVSYEYSDATMWKLGAAASVAPLGSGLTQHSVGGLSAGTT